jgi:D-aminoacyl-tRNA deacylase
VSKPAAFVEIGSDHEQWNDRNAAEIIAKSLIEAVCSDKEYKTAAAIGGPHYMPNFKDIMLKTDTAIGHCCPKHALQFLDERLIHQSIERCNSQVNYLVLDWKGLSEHKSKVLRLAEKLGIDYKKTKDLYKAD